MTSSIILIFLSILMAVYLRLQRGKNPRIPRPTSPSGSITRIVGWVLTGALVVTLVFNVVLGGLTESNVVLTLTAIVIAITIYMRAKRES